MTTFVLSLPLIAVAWILPIVPTHAQPNPAFVAAKGSDSNPCTVALPCRSFQHAHDVIAANGEIDVLDPGAGYGTLNITKSISIQGHGFASIIVSSGVSGIAIHAGASDAVSSQWAAYRWRRLRGDRHCILQRQFARGGKLCSPQTHRLWHCDRFRGIGTGHCLGHGVSG